MEQEFKTIYDELNKKYCEQYKLAVSKKTKKNGLRLLSAWMIISFIQTILIRLGYKETDIYAIMDLMASFIVVILVILVLYMFNNNFGYWCKAFEFKRKIGVEFWKAVNPNIKYQPVRAEIDSNLVKNELNNMLSQNTNIIDIEESLEFENKKLYTIRYNTADKKRFNGVFGIIENYKLTQSDEELENKIKNSNTQISTELKKVVQKDDKLYFLLDAVEIFKINDNNYLNQKELYNNYKRFKDISEYK